MSVFFGNVSRRELTSSSGADLSADQSGPLYEYQSCRIALTTRRDSLPAKTGFQKATANAAGSSTQGSFAFPTHGELRLSRSIKAENLLLWRQLALYIERGVKPRRIDLVTRIALTLLSRRLKWRDAWVVVRPQTMIRWHRAGWRLFWRMKSRPGRPPIPAELRAMIRQIANENPSSGEERIANELLLKIGIRVSPRTVNKYLPRRPRGQPRAIYAGQLSCACMRRESSPATSVLPLPPSSGCCMCSW
jgi:hypothetical protein